MYRSLEYIIITSCSLVSVFLTLCFVLFRAAFILATWLGGFTLIYTTGVVQNLKKNVLLSLHRERRTINVLGDLSLYTEKKKRNNPIPIPIP